MAFILCQKWACEKRGNSGFKTGETVEFSSQKLRSGNEEYPIKWIFNDFALAVYIGPHRTRCWVSPVLFLFDTETGKLLAYKISKTVGKDEFGVFSTAELSDVERGPRSKSKISKILFDNYEKSPEKLKITRTFSPFCAQVVCEGEKQARQMICVASVQNNENLYVFREGVKYAEMYYRKYDESEIIRVGCFRDPKAKRPNEISGLDSKMFSQLSPVDGMFLCLPPKFQCSSIYMDEFLEGKYGDLSKKFDVVVVGGGSATNFQEALGENGTIEILNFVQNGGGYFGICMGSYLPLCEVITSGYNSERFPFYGWGMVFLGLKDGIGKGENPPSDRKDYRNNCYLGKYTREGKKFFYSNYPSGCEVVDVFRYVNGPVFRKMVKSEFPTYREKYLARLEFKKKFKLRDHIKELPKPQKQPTVLIEWAEEHVVVEKEGVGEYVGIKGSPCVVSQEYGKGRLIISSGHMDLSMGHYFSLTRLNLKKMVYWLIENKVKL